MSRRLDIAIASYGKDPEKLVRTVQSIKDRSRTDWRCFIIHNPSDGDQETRKALAQLASLDARLIVSWENDNIGYAGSVNTLFKAGETEYLAWCDNDIEIHTDGWDELLCRALDTWHEIGMIFPNNGPYSIDRGNYQEVMWGVGFCWIVNRLAVKDTGLFDQALGHQDEADYALRLRMAGWKCAALPSVSVRHDATATNDPASIERINAGVRRWVDKWNRYFNGVHFNYHSANVTRWHDWPPNALYLEEWFKLQRAMNTAGVQLKLADLNSPTDENVDFVTICGEHFDLIRVPRLAGFYRNRII